MVFRALGVLLTLSMLLTPAARAETASQSQLIPKTQQQKKYPRVVLYSVAWCPHCKEAKDYFTRNNIPFINKDVELDDKYLKELTDTYKSTGVPIIVIGADKRILKGFKKEEFEKALKEAATP